MTEVTLSLEALAAGSGRGVRVAVIDSGVHASHPHVGGVAGGTAFDDEGREHDDVVDRLGHGTAVTAVIREKAPEAELFCVKVFDRELASTGRALVEALRWSVAHHMHLINLSLGTTNREHEAALAAAIAEARAAGARVVAAAPQPHARWLPGGLAGVTGVTLDWTCPRSECVLHEEANGAVQARASGYPRPIPGVPPGRNLQGLSFAVANVTGLLARAASQQAGAR